MGLKIRLTRVHPYQIVTIGQYYLIAKALPDCSLSCGMMADNETPVFARIPPAAVFDPAVTPMALRVLAALCTYIDQDGKCWPSVGTLSERLGEGYSPRMVQRHLRALEDAGWITTEVQPNGVGKSSNIYRVRFDSAALADGAGVTQDDTPTPDTVCHPPMTQDDTPRVSPGDTLTRLTELNQESDSKGTIPGPHQQLSEVSRSVTRDSSRKGRKHASQHLVDRCAAFAGSVEQAWEFVASLDMPEIERLAAEKGFEPMRLYQAHMAGTAGHPRGSLGKQQREVVNG